MPGFVPLTVLAPVDSIGTAAGFSAIGGSPLHRVVVGCRITEADGLPATAPTTIARLNVTVGLPLVGVAAGALQSANLGLGLLIQYGGQIFGLAIVIRGDRFLALYLAIASLDATAANGRAG